MIHSDQTISEKSKMPLSMVITIVSGIVAFTFWQGVLYTDVQYLKKQNEQIIARLDGLESRNIIALERGGVE